MGHFRSTFGVPVALAVAWRQSGDPFSVVASEPDSRPRSVLVGCMDYSPSKVEGRRGADEQRRLFGAWLLKQTKTASIENVFHHICTPVCIHVSIYIYMDLSSYMQRCFHRHPVRIRIQSRSSERATQFKFEKSRSWLCLWIRVFLSLTVHGSEFKQKQLRNSITGLAPNIHIYRLWLSCGNKLWSLLPDSSDLHFVLRK